MNWEAVLGVIDLTERALGINVISAAVVVLGIIGAVLWIKKSVKVHIDRLATPSRKTLSVKQDLVINEALSHICFSLSASRAFVFQRHNGDHNAVTGMSFKKISMTHEFAEPGASLCSTCWQGIPLGVFAYWYERLRERREMAIPDALNIKESDTSGYQILKDNHVSSIYLIALFGFESNEPIAFVGVAYQGKTVKLNEAQMESLRAAAFKICGCLLLEE